MCTRCNIKSCPSYATGGEYKNGHSAQLYGVNHISITTMDINKTLGYYVNELGGHFVDDIQPSNLQSMFVVYNFMIFSTKLLITENKK